MELRLQFFFLVVMALSAILHEYLHGWQAERLGDPTARLAGRLTLDPRAHLDLVGSFLLPLGLLILTRGSFMFAYAKPMPVNPHNLRGRHGDAAVALAGPAANFFLAVVFGLLVRFLPISSFSVFLSLIVYVNILLGVFNLVPIPPLDGSKILFSFLPYRFHSLQVYLETYGFVLLFIFIFFLFGWLMPIISGLFQFLVGQSFF